MNEAEFTFKTPAVTQEIKNIRLDGYKNIFEYESNPFPDPSHPNLWGTETLCGDWDGKLLIILKDFGPTGYVEKRGDGRPGYSHRINSATNANLVRFISEAGHELDAKGEKNTSCGILYASACFLLKIGDGVQTRISADALTASWPAIEFTIQRMNHLSDIVLCGRHAISSFRKNAIDKPLQFGDTAHLGNRRVHATCHTNPQAVISRGDAKRLGKPGRDVTQEEWNRIIRACFGDSHA